MTAAQVSGSTRNDHRLRLSVPLVQEQVGQQLVARLYLALGKACEVRELSDIFDSRAVHLLHGLAGDHPAT
jgi:hypothetical protein